RVPHRNSKIGEEGGDRRPAGSAVLVLVEVDDHRLLDRVPFTDFPPATDLDLDLVRRDRLGLLDSVRRRGLDVTLLGGEVVLWRELVVGSGHLRLLRTRWASPSTVRVVPGRGPPGRAPAARRRRR